MSICTYGTVEWGVGGYESESESEYDGPCTREADLSPAAGQAEVSPLWEEEG